MDYKKFLKTVSGSLLFWKDPFIKSFKTKHYVLARAIHYVAFIKGDKYIIDDVTAFKIEVLVNWNKRKAENFIAAEFLIGGEYLKLHLQDDIRYVSIEPRGLKAYQSQEFLNQYKEKIRARNNNRWMILLNVVVALGVIYSIYKDEFKGTPSLDNITKRLDKLESKNVDSLKAPTNPCRP